MSDFYEIDFLKINAEQSGDAIAMRYSLGGKSCIHIVDGGFQDTGEDLVKHINYYYNNPTLIDHVVVTHPDRDHAGGIKTVLESFDIGCLWMLRPWKYVDKLMGSFPQFSNKQNLIKRLKDDYPTIAKLEEIANSKGIQIKEPVEGEYIGRFKVLSPSEQLYLSLVERSEKTPEASKTDSTSYTKSSQFDEEGFSTQDTSAENNMSVVQFATLYGQNILLTGDAGKEALQEIIKNYNFPEINIFQVPHHGSRRNLSSEILNHLFPNTNTAFTAIISASKEDMNHPRKAVVRAMYQRGGIVYSNQNRCHCHSFNAPNRSGWGIAVPLPRPIKQEVDYEIQDPIHSMLKHNLQI